MEIKKVLLTVSYRDWHLDKLLEALAPAEVILAEPGDDEAVLAGVRDADVAILDGDLDDRILTGRNLRWIHCNHSGLNQSARSEIFERNIILTGSAGRSAPVLAEHALFLTLSLIYHAHAMHDAQRAHQWRGAGDYSQDRGLYGKTMGIIGMGYTGKELAERAKQFHMNVVAYDRYDIPNLKNVDEFYCLDHNESIDPLLAKSDVVVLCCRLSDETYHLMDKAAFEKMKPTALLINMARGPVVDSDALLYALKNHVIAGAGSDVFEQEPLPENSPLWDAPNLVITPHCTPEMPDMPARCVDIMTENIRRYRANEPMMNQLVSRDVFTH